MELRLPCAYCGANYAPEKLRVKSNKSETWKCHNCCSKLNLVQRHYGSWPPPNWNLLSDAQQQQVFSESGSKLDSLLRQLKVVNSHRDKNFRTDKAAGRFLPLSAWRQQGFEIPEGFEEDCPPSHKEWHEQLQIWTYNIEIREVEDGSTRSNIKDQSIEAAFNRQKGRVDSKGGVKFAKKGESLSSSSSSDSESSDESSSHGNPKKRKQLDAKRNNRKAAKAKRKARKAAARSKDKERRTKEKEKRAEKKEKKREKKEKDKRSKEEKAQKTAETQNKKMRDIAMAIADNAGTVVTQARAVVEDRFYSEIGGPMKTTFEAALRTVETMKSEAHKVTMPPDLHTLPKDYDTVKSATLKIKPLNDEVTKLTQVLKAMRKARTG